MRVSAIHWLFVCVVGSVALLGWLLVPLAAGAAPALQGTNLISNGSFDSDAAGWTLIYSAWQPGGYVALSSNTYPRAIQTLGTLEPGDYLIQFDGRGTNEQIDVSLGGYGGLSCEIALSSDWQTYTCALSPDVQITSLRLMALNEVGADIDNVALFYTPAAPTATPEPATATPAPPTATATPEPATATPAPPTATPEPPTATPEPGQPTNTPEPATATPEPGQPTNTPEPTATEVPSPTPFRERYTCYLPYIVADGDSRRAAAMVESGERHAPARRRPGAGMEH